MKQLRYLLLIGICLSVNIQADESKKVTLLLGVNTYHFSNNPMSSNDNEIVGLLVDRWFITHYKNSHQDESWGFGYTLGNWQYKINPESPFTFKGRIWAGAATGYGDRLLIHWGPLTFAFVPEVSTEIELTDNWATGYSGLYIWTDAGGVWVNGIQLSYRF